MSVGTLVDALALGSDVSVFLINTEGATEPSAINVIPSAAAFTVNLRNPAEDRLRSQEAAFALVFGNERPFLTVVDPSRAACLFESAKAGHIVKVPLDKPTVMAMLECYEPSLVDGILELATAYARAQLGAWNDQQAAESCIGFHKRLGPVVVAVPRLALSTEIFTGSARAAVGPRDAWSLPDQEAVGRLDSGGFRAEPRPTAPQSSLQKIPIFRQNGLDPVDIHRSHIMAPTRNSMDANESAVFS